MFGLLFGGSTKPEQVGVKEKTSEDELRETIHEFAIKVSEGEKVLSTTITFSENGSRPVSDTIGFDWLDDLREKKMPRNSSVGLFGISSVNSVRKVSLKSFDPDTKIQNRINIYVGQSMGIYQVFSPKDIQSYLFHSTNNCNGYNLSSELDELLRNVDYDSSTRVIVEGTDCTSTPLVSVMEPDVDTPEQSSTSIVFKNSDEFFKNIGIIKEELDKVLNKDNNKGLKKQFGKN